MFKPKLTVTKLIITVILTLGISISFQSLLAAWTAPTVAPPGDNLGQPIDTSASIQTKDGDLGVLGNLSIDTNTLVVDSTNNRVGIGTNAPGYKLSVKNTVNEGDVAYFEDDDGNFIRFAQNGAIEINSNNGVGDFVFLDAESDMYVPGNVGIGTNAPGQKLHVNGSIYLSGNEIINNTSPTVYFQDTDHRSAMIHVNSNWFYVLRGCGNNSTSWCQTGGYWPLVINLENNDATFGGSVQATGLHFATDRGSHWETDGTLYRNGGQVYLTVDDNFYIRDAGTGNPFHFDTNSAHLTVNGGWAPAQALTINSNQIWKSQTAGDSNLYLQYSCEGCGVVIGDNVGSANNLTVHGDVTARDGLNVTGNVGIGTTNPGAKLEIHQQGLGLYLNQGAANDIYMRYHVPGVRWWTVGSKANGDFWFSNASDLSDTGPLILKSNGNVGIGTTDPKATLGVAGRINQSHLGGSTFIGYEAGLSDDLTNNYNTAVGYISLRSNNMGSHNTAVGYRSLYSNTTGRFNTAIGHSVLDSCTAGSYNTAIGFFADTASNNLTNATAIGYDAKVTASNRVRIGNNAITRISGIVGFSADSDARLKKNINESLLGLDFILKLKPATFNYIVPGQEGITYTGMIAQDVEKALKEIGADFSGLGKPENDKDFYQLRYAEFVTPIIKAMQEQQEQIEEQQKQIEEMKIEIKKFKTE